jgi:hypothetical protein
MKQIGSFLAAYKEIEVQRNENVRYEPDLVVRFAQEVTMDPISIQKELAQMPEWERLSEIRQFNLSIQIFQQNSGELVGLLRSVKTGPAAMRLWSVENQPLLDQLLCEVARLLHNFVAASFSLVDHARRFHKRNYKSDGRFADYEIQVKARFADDPLCQFVQDLRNFFIHRKVPNVSSTMSFTQGQDIDNTLFLEKADLESFEWKTLARNYLDQAPGKIDLLMLASSYTTKVTDFYKWVFERLQEIHANDLAVVHAKQEDLKRAIGAMAQRHLEADIAISREIRTAPEQYFLAFIDHGTWSRLCADNPEPVDRANALLDEVEKLSPPLGKIRAEMIETFKRFYRKH